MQLQTLLIIRPIISYGIVYRDEETVVYAMHAARGENVSRLRGHRFHTIILSPYTIIGRATEMQLAQIMTMLTPSGSVLQLNADGQPPTEFKFAHKTEE